jgi:hypothetical protein
MEGPTVQRLTIYQSAETSPDSRPNGRDANSVEPSSAPQSFPTRSTTKAGPDQQAAPSIGVRPARASDMLGLRDIQDVLRLNQPEELLTGFHPVRRGVAGSLPWVKTRTRFFVAHVGARLVGFVQFDPLLPDQRWVLTAIGANGTEEEKLRIWEALLAHAVIVAGSNGVKRLFARVNDQLAVREALARVGFGAYASETVYAAFDRLPPTSAPSLRRQVQTDTWAIHQLYNAAVPRDVQYAEAFTSHRWDVERRPGRVPRHGQMVGWLIEEGHHVIGHVRLASREGTHVLEIVYHPERREVIDPLLDCALAHVIQQQPRRVYCALRSYQAEATDELERRGFEAMFDQELFVKYTTANVRVPSLESVPLHIEVREKLPQRVPTFLHGRPRDESVT